MPYIKKLDIFIAKSFLLLFVGTFFICLFIFMMQFLWRYVDELVGKGFEMDVMAQFFFYSALTLVPLSLPLAILLASLMTFGNFGERYELLAMKSAGISLLKIMRPLIVVVSVLVIVSFYFQNVIAPIAQGKLGTLILSMKQKSPELDIPEGVFYSEIANYNLKIAKKNRKTGMMYDVLIYNLEDGFENAHIIYADSGRLEMTADKQHLWLHLFDGDLFENLKSQNKNAKNVPYRREEFKMKDILIAFNSDFNMVDSDIMGRRSSTKNMRQLQVSIDSMTVVTDSIGTQYYKEVTEKNFRKPEVSKLDTIKLSETGNMSYNLDSLFNAASLKEKQRMLNAAVSRAENMSNDLTFKSSNLESTEYSIRTHKTEWHRKITISLSCLLFFFIGAPLGSIIRKGGLGMPVIVSVLVFIIYYIIDNSAYKMARDGKWIVWMGMWTSNTVLAGLGVFLTYKSNRDSVALNADAYILLLKRLAGIRSERQLTRKEVIINDPDYTTLPSRLDNLTAKTQAYLREQTPQKAPNYLKLWLSEGDTQTIPMLVKELEDLIEEMSNTQSAMLIETLNQYPIPSTQAHQIPFSSKRWRLACCVVFPVGLLFYIRVRLYRIRLAGDLEKIIKTNNQAKYFINKIKE